MCRHSRYAVARGELQGGLQAERELISLPLILAKYAEAGQLDPGMGVITLDEVKEITDFAKWVFLKDGYSVKDGLKTGTSQTTLLKV